MFSIKQLQQLSTFLIVEFKEVFVTKEDISRIEGRLDVMQNNIDGFRVDKQDEWIGKASATTGVSYNP